MLNVFIFFIYWNLFRLLSTLIEQTCDEKHSICEQSVPKRKTSSNKSFPILRRYNVMKAKFVRINRPTYYVSTFSPDCANLRLNAVQLWSFRLFIFPMYHFLYFFKIDTSLLFLVPYYHIEVPPQIANRLINTWNTFCFVIVVCSGNSVCLLN